MSETPDLHSLILSRTDADLDTLTADAFVRLVSSAPLLHFDAFVEVSLEGPPAPEDPDQWPDTPPYTLTTTSLLAITPDRIVYATTIQDSRTSAVERTLQALPLSTLLRLELLPYPLLVFPDTSLPLRLDPDTPLTRDLFDLLLGVHPKPSPSTLSSS